MLCFKGQPVCEKHFGQVGNAGSNHQGIEGYSEILVELSPNNFFSLIQQCVPVDILVPQGQERGQGQEKCLLSFTFLHGFFNTTKSKVR